MVHYGVRDRIGYITLNRPEKRNALSFELVSELKAVFLEAENDPEAKVVVLKANGDVFCSGADLAFLQQLQNFSMEDNLADSRHLGGLFNQIYTLKKVVIAQVQGHAIAGGCGLATVCDFIFAVPEAKFGYTEVKIGFIPAIVMIFLLRKVSEQKAKQLLLSGELVAGVKAIEAGIVNQLFDAAILENSVYEFAQKLIRNNSGEAMETTKKMIAEVQSMPLETALDYAAKMNALARNSEDCKKGVKAFLDKQNISW